LEIGSVLQSDSKSSKLRSKPKSKPASKTVSKPTTVLVKLLKNSTYKIVGESGKQYVFQGSGSVLAVEKEDIKTLMEKNNNRPNSCCSGTLGNKIFELVSKE